jgi:hypothetical protein
MSDLIYTCVFENYDWVFPPIAPLPSIKHIIVTDRLGPESAGWERLVVDPARWGGPVSANRYWKIMGHVEMRGFSRTLYVDANIRLLGNSSAFLDEALPPGAAMGLFRHPLRSSVVAEMDACLAAGKSVDAARLAEEHGFYIRQGFPDDLGMSENTILARRPHAPGLDAAMRDWWEIYHRFESRDQFSLPVVRWRHHLPVHWIEWSFRDLNPWFAIYGHRKGRGINPGFAWVEARAHDSTAHAALLQGWLMARELRRGFRRIVSRRST